MKVNVLIILLTLILLTWASSTSAQTPADEQSEIVRINGTAYWATRPTGPDFQGVTLIPLPARNPTRDAWEETLAQNERYLAPGAVPQNVQVSHSGWITGASRFVNDFSEVMVALDPTDPNHLLGCSKFFYDPLNYGFYTGVFESFDGGHTWTELQPPGVELYSLTSDPVTTFDDQGNGYFTLLTRGPTGLDMLKKPVGAGWELPVVVDRSTVTDKQWIIGDQDPQGASPFAGYLYMSWTSFSPPEGIVVARSTNSNQSWSAPLLLASGDVQGSVPGVAPDGTVYVVYGRNIFDVGPATIEFVKSSNGGVSFSAPAVAANITAIPFFLPGSWFRTPASLPAFAVSPVNGNLYVAWADYRHGDADIYSSRSTDGGATWDTPVRLNDDPIANGVDQFQPQVAVAPNGRVAVMWFDRRLTCPHVSWIPPVHRGRANFCIDTFMTRSYDDGQTWIPNIRASAQTWDWALNLPRDGSGNGFIGDYQGIVSNNDYDFPFWNATANLGENAENYQEVFVALVPGPFLNLSASSKTVEPTIAAPGSVLTYSLTLVNAGPDDATATRMIDTLPLSTTYVLDSLTYPAGSGGYDAASGIITWTGAVSVGLPVTITFQAMVDHAPGTGTLVTRWAIVNEATITDDAGVDYEREATAIISRAPFILETYPPHGEGDVPLGAPLLVRFSQPMITSTLLYTVTPDPGGWVAAWSDDDMTVTLNHDDWVYAQTCTVVVAASEQGRTLALGPLLGLTPNPWSFTTDSRSFRTYLPLVVKGGP